MHLMNIHPNPASDCCLSVEKHIDYICLFCRHLNAKIQSISPSVAAEHHIILQRYKPYPWSLLSNTISCCKDTNHVNVRCCLTISCCKDAKHTHASCLTLRPVAEIQKMKHIPCPLLQTCKPYPCPLLSNTISCRKDTNHIPVPCCLTLSYYKDTEIQTMPMPLPV